MVASGVLVVSLLKAIRKGGDWVDPLELMPVMYRLYTPAYLSRAAIRSKKISDKSNPSMVIISGARIVLNSHLSNMIAFDYIERDVPRWIHNRRRLVRLTKKGRKRLRRGLKANQKAPAASRALHTQGNSTGT